MRPQLIQHFVWIALLALGIVCVVVGVMRDELMTVFTTATKICFQCIGIG